MSILSCLGKLVTRGQITEEQRAQAEAIYRGAYERLYPQMGPAAEARAAIETAEAMEKYAAQHRLRLAQNKIATNAARERVNSHPGGRMAGLQALMTDDLHGVPGENIDGLKVAYETRAATMLNQLMKNYGSQLGGLKGGEFDIKNAIREVMGVDTGDPTAKAFAKAWGDLTGPEGEFVQAARAMGKEFTPADDWALPQHWDTGRAQKFKPETLMADWRDAIKTGGLKVFDPETHAEASPLKVESILAASAQKIVKDLPYEGAAGGAGGAFAHDMRVFRFTQDAAGAEAYIRLMGKYGPGPGGFVPMLQGHVERMARDLAGTRLLGPDWRGNLRGLFTEAAEANAADKFAGVDPAVTYNGDRDLAARWTMNAIQNEGQTEKMIRYMTGESSQVNSRLVHSIFKGYRGFASARKMAGGTVTAVFQDPVNMLMEGNWLGLNRGRMFGSMIQQMLGLGGELTEGEKVKLGIISRAAIDEAIGVKRFEDQWLGESLGTRLGNFMVRSSRLAKWDEIMRSTFQKEFMGAIGDRAGQAFDALDGAFKDHFVTRFGFTPDEWATLADPANHFKIGAASFLDVDRLHSVDEALRQKVLGAMANERTFAYVVGGSTRARSFLTQGFGKPGTVSGELARGAFQFKTWPSTYLTGWVPRALMETGYQAKAAVAAQMLIFGSLAGAMTLQAKSLLYGKTPRDMTDPHFWLAAAIQGEVAGLASAAVTDFMAKDSGTLLETLAGPMYSDYKTLHDVVVGGGRDVVLGEKRNWGEATARAIRDATPGNTSWYARLVTQRMMFDKIQEMMDPQYRRSFARQAERLRKTTGQSFWWAPGATTPGATVQ